MLKTTNSQSFMIQQPQFSLQNPNEFSLKDTLKELIQVQFTLPILRLILVWSLLGVIGSFVSNYLTNIITLLGEVSLMVALARNLMLGEEIPFLRASLLELKCLGAYLIFIIVTLLIALPLVLSYAGNHGGGIPIFGFFSFVALLWLMPTLLHFVVLSTYHRSYKEAFFLAKSITFPINLSLVLGVLLICLSIFILAFPLIIVFGKMATPLAILINMVSEFIQTILLTRFACIVIRMRVVI